MGPSLAEFGELGHLILKLTYEDLIRRGYFRGDVSAFTVDTVLTTRHRKLSPTMRRIIPLVIL